MVEDLSSDRQMFCLFWDPQLGNLAKSNLKIFDLQSTTHKAEELKREDDMTPVGDIGIL